MSRKESNRQKNNLKYNFRDIDFTKPVELYTIQHKNQIINLEKKGYLTGSEEYIEPSFIESYRWMVRKMIYRNQILIPNVLKNKINLYPIWFWYNSSSLSSSRNRKPDLRSSGYAERGTELVLLTFKKDWKDILLSDFEMWHFVLNQVLLPHNDYFKSIEKIIDKKYQQRHYKELPEKYQRLLNESWNIIFDMEYDDPEFTEPFISKRLQGTTWYVKDDEIIDTQYFHAK